MLQPRAQSLPAILTYFALTFAWSWGIGIAASGIAKTAPVLNAALMMVAGYGPSVAGLAVVVAFSPRTEKGAGLRAWLVRCLNWRVGWKYYAFAFCLPPALMVIALGLHSLLGGPMPKLVSVDHIPLAILNFGLVFLVGGPLGEEFGWRGYALPALAAKLNWRLASLIIGAVWGLWHLPLFLMATTLQSQMHIAVFMLNILAGSVVFAWLAERTRQSVIPALVLHTSLNGWTGILGIVPTAETGRPYLLVTGLLVLVALVLLLRSQNSPHHYNRVRKSHDFSL
jgi:uncharacterized protein